MGFTVRRCSWVKAVFYLLAMAAFLWRHEGPHKLYFSYLDNN